MDTKMEIAEIGDRNAGAWVQLAKAPNQVAKLEAAKRATQLVRVPEASRPVPRFFLDLPWAVDNQEIIDSILERMILTDDLVQASAESEPVKAEALLSTHVTVHDVRARPSDVKDARWGAYMLMDVSTPTESHIPVACGAAEVCVTMWKAFCSGAMPIKGRFTLLGNPTEGRNQPIGFVVLPAAEKVA